MSQRREFVIKIPRLDGYKTVTINGLVILFGLINIAYPTFVSPSPETVALVVNETAGVIITVVGLINMVLRMVTDTAVFKGPENADDLPHNAIRDSITDVYVSDYGVHPTDREGRIIIDPSQLGAGAKKSDPPFSDSSSGSLYNPNNMQQNFSGNNFDENPSVSKDNTEKVDPETSSSGPNNNIDIMALPVKRLSNPLADEIREHNVLNENSSVSNPVSNNFDPETLPDSYFDTQVMSENLDTVKNIDETQDLSYEMDTYEDVIPDFDYLEKSVSLNAAENLEETVAENLEIDIDNISEKDLDEVAEKLAQSLKEPVSETEKLPQFLEKEPMRDRKTAKKKAIAAAGMDKLSTYFVAMVMCMSVFITGCATLASIDPIGAAKTVEQRAYGVYGTYVIFQERAVPIVRDKKIPITIRRRIQQADRIVKPSADVVLATVKELSQARAAYQAGLDTKERITILVTRLESGISTLTPKVQALVAAVQDADRKQ